MYQTEIRLKNQEVLSFLGGSTSAMHFQKADETGTCTKVFLLRLVTLDLVSN